MGRTMMDSGYTRTIRATDATDATKSEIPGPITQSSTTDASIACGTSTYQDVSVQTRPIRSVPQFREVFGRDPLQGEVGIAAIGRYTNKNGGSIYDLKNGPPFSRTRAETNKPEYVDSSFQTIDPKKTIQMITKAKVKASITVGKYRKVAEEAGFEVFAESNIKRVIHSEQFPTVIVLDAEGNTKDGDLGSQLLPNIYGKKITPKEQQSTATSWLSPKITKMSSSRHAIASLAPSLREDVPNPEPKEDYGEYTKKSRGKGKHLPSMGETGRGDEVSPLSFVVYDPACFPDPKPPVKLANGSSSLKKRKLSIESEYPPAQSSSKRHRVSFSPARTICHGEIPPSAATKGIHETTDLRQANREVVQGKTNHQARDTNKAPKTLASPGFCETDIPRGPRQGRAITSNATSRLSRQRSASPRAHSRGSSADYRSRSPAARRTQTYRSRDSHYEEKAKETITNGEHDTRTHRSYPDSGRDEKRSESSPMRGKAIQSTQTETLHSKKAASSGATADVQTMTESATGHKDSVDTVPRTASSKPKEMVEKVLSTAPNDSTDVLPKEVREPKSVRESREVHEIVSTKSSATAKEPKPSRDAGSQAKPASVIQALGVEKKQQSQGHREKTTSAPRSITRDNNSNNNNETKPALRETRQSQNYSNNEETKPAPRETRPSEKHRNNEVSNSAPRETTLQSTFHRNNEAARPAPRETTHHHHHHQHKNNEAARPTPRETIHKRNPPNTDTITHTHTHTHHTTPPRHTSAPTTPPPSPQQPQIQTHARTSSRVEKRNAPPVEHGAKRGNVARFKDDDEKKQQDRNTNRNRDRNGSKEHAATPTPGRKPLPGKRPHRDPRVLINKWLGV